MPSIHAYDINRLNHSLFGASLLFFCLVVIILGLLKILPFVFYFSLLNFLELQHSPLLLLQILLFDQLLKELLSLVEILASLPLVNLAHQIE